MIRLLNNKDTEKVLSYLERHHIETTFLIGNVSLYGLEDNPAIRRAGEYYGYFEEDCLKGILPFYNLGSCIPHYETPNAISHFAILLKEKKYNFLLGMEKIIKPLYEAIKDVKITLDYSEDSYYINDNFKPFLLENVTFKDSDAENSDMIDFAMRARKEGFHQEASAEQIIGTLKPAAPDEDFIFIMKENKIVAQALIQTFTSKINQVGGVFTAPETRGNGYCKAVVSEICKRIIARGKTPTLMVTKANTPAVKAYSALGFRHYDDYLIIEF